MQSIFRMASDSKNYYSLQLWSEAKFFGNHLTQVFFLYARRGGPWRLQATTDEWSKEYTSLENAKAAFYAWRRICAREILRQGIKDEFVPVYERALAKLSDAVLDEVGVNAMLNALMDISPELLEQTLAKSAAN